MGLLRRKWRYRASAQTREDTEQEQRLRLLRETYAEVLAATKHEDAKIGRFLAALAFLVAGVLAISDPDVLATRYRFGDVLLPLPSWAFVGFLASVTFAVLFYVLAVGTPLTVPPSMARARTGRTRSLIFFDRIALEDLPSWRSRWMTPMRALVPDLIDDYVQESLNIARRARNKRARSLEASALVTLTLLFFAAAALISVDVWSVYPQDGGGSEARAPVLEWTTYRRTACAALLSAFSLSLLYQQRRRRQLRREEADSPAGWWAMACGFALFPICVLVMSAWQCRGITAGFAAALTVLVVLGYLLVRRPTGSPGVLGIAERAGVVSIAIVIGATAASAIAVERAEYQLLIAVIAAASPLAGTAAKSFIETRETRPLLTR